MVLLRARDAVRRHDGVARELLDRSSSGLDLGRHRVVETVEELAGSLRILSAQLGRADEIREENRRELPLFPGRKPRLLGPAGGAKARVIRDGPPARRARCHAPDCRTPLSALPVTVRGS